MARPKKTSDVLLRFRQVLRYFAPALKQEKGLIFTSSLALFASIAFRLLEPWPLKIVLDLINPRTTSKDLGIFQGLMKLSPETALAVVSIGLIIIVGLRASSDYFRTVGFAKIGNRVITRVRGDLYRHIQSLSLSFHDKSRSGDLLVRVISDIRVLRDIAITAMLPLAASVLILVGMVTVMFIVNWQLSLLSLIILPLFALSTVRLGRRIHDAARKQRRREGAMAATAAEAISSVKVVQALSLQDHFSDSFSSQNRRNRTQDVKTRRLAAQLERTADILIATATATVMWYGAKLVLQGEFTASYLVAFLWYIKQGFRPLQDLAKYTGRLAKATAAGERIVELLEQTPEIQDEPNAVEAPPLRGKIEFSHVQFAYEGKPPIYQDLSLSIPPGKLVALVGQSGVGKSTLLSLLLRLYVLQQGTIKIDGTDTRQWTLESLRGQIGIVLQETVLFAANVYENISLGSPELDRRTIVSAARLANAHEFIEALPQGYETMLGERGVNLSQGQRQRIAIARAAIRNAPLLLLDEPTVGLDERNEREVRAALKRLAQGKTTLLVTHDLRQAAEADLVFFIADGFVQESGTHRELIERSGLYAELYRSQTGTTTLAS